MPIPTTRKRVSDAGSALWYFLVSIMSWFPDKWRWREMERRASRFFSQHFRFTTVVQYWWLPLAILFYIGAGVFLLFEEFGKFVEKILQYCKEPRRTLLSEKEIKRRRERRVERDRVKELPFLRPRALTLRSGTLGERTGFYDPRHVKQKTVDQLGACDLWKLPFEVRETIWRYAVGGNYIHIVKRRGRFGNVYCPAKDATDPVHRDFCVRRDDQGYYVKSEWPKDMKPLSLLVTCRQIYSECIDFLYSHNVFAFDDPALLNPFLHFLLPRRSQLIASFHFAAAFGHETSNLGRGHLNIGNRFAVVDTVNFLGYALNTLAQRSNLYSLTITPKMKLDFKTTDGYSTLRTFIPAFLGALNNMRAATPIVVAWPEHQTHLPASAPLYMVNGLNGWGRYMDLLLPWEFRTFEVREMPWQSSTVLMMFFTPFHVQCLHCASYTLIRCTTKCSVEASFVQLSKSPSPPTYPSLTGVLVRYWTFHFCGGWIEFQYHGGRKEWSVTQGARTVSEDEADAHLAGLGEEARNRMYPAMENAHERFRGISVLNSMMQGTRPWAGMPLKVIDEPTRDTYYKNVGWVPGGRDRNRGVAND